MLVALAAIILFAIWATFVHNGIHKRGGVGAVYVMLGFPFFLAGVFCMYHIFLGWPVWPWLPRYGF